MIKQSKDNFLLGENDVTEKDVADVNLLLLQMSPRAVAIDLKKVKAVMRHGVIVTIRDADRDGQLIGMGTLLIINKLFTLCGTIEDVVVREDYRGQGLGRKITETLIAKGESLGMQFVDLTSSPKRKVANQLYQSAGFEKRETNLYRRYLK
ncbi:MAG: GNAT family N-acetyltransferase [Parcubacteria group bacterium]|jgi:ribosomal protein S18 acetylase RimI-like enzyme